MTKFRDFESAREFAISLNLKGQKEWFEYCKSGDKPYDIPTVPERIYKKDFKGYGDWIGTGTVATSNKVFRSFQEAREFVRKLNLKGQKEWYKYCKSGDKPYDIPTVPDKVYKNKFKGIGDWLGTGRTRNFKSFKESREFVRSLGLKNRKEWQNFTKSKQMPGDIPITPHGTYKKDFKGWGDFLGTGTVATSNKVFRSFEKAREFARALKLNSRKEWSEYCKSGNKPDDIPAYLRTIYKNEWKGWGDWLGTGTVAPKDKVFRSFKDAREFVRKLGLKNMKEWLEYCKSGNKPDDIPTYPWKSYMEWKKK